MMVSQKTVRKIALEKSGLSHDHVARLIDVSPAYLKVLLRQGAKSYCTAERLRKVLGCRIELFLPTQPAPDRKASQARKASQHRKEPSQGRTAACKTEGTRMK